MVGVKKCQKSPANTLILSACYGYYHCHGEIIHQPWFQEIGENKKNCCGHMSLQMLLSNYSVVFFLIVGI